MNFHTDRPQSDHCLIYSSSNDTKSAKAVTDLAQQLLRERNNAPELEYPRVTTRIPVTDLTVYTELIEAPPSIEEDFFRSPLTKEERKISINSC
ncbi:hypothetical protein AYI70_g9621 [Smittium culicis]|uniref:Uncharacterized protein n=1 Tax=Smittium culicis TaxID=133412 RepID=A0A1R1XAD6_9FUNG|nr:hypothetical protein AYI70_g9621 [Smittium culicis]